jgi:hypothetical protein
MANKGSGDGKSLIQVAFPAQANVVFFTAVVLGLVLAGSSTAFRPYFALNGTQSDLVLCIGCALVLAAFGGQATVRVGGAIMAGAAALALGLFVYLHSISDALFVRGTVHYFDYQKYESLDITQSNRVLGRIEQNDSNPQRSRYDFVLFKSEIDGGTIEVSLTARDTNTEQLLAVDVADVDWAFGDRRRLEWELREVSDGGEKILTLFERSRKREIAREGTVRLSDNQSRSGSNRTGFPWMAIALAAAAPQKVDVPLMLRRLKSDDAGTRRDARNALAQAPLESVPTIMQTFATQLSDYRVKLGVCVAMTQMLRRDTKIAPAIVKLLTNDDVARLVDVTGDPDPTVRVYATEFLVALRDSRATNLAIRRAASTQDDNARYNWLLVTQAGWPTLTAAEKQTLAPQVQQTRQSAGLKTKALSDKLK